MLNIPVTILTVTFLLNAVATLPMCVADEMKTANPATNQIYDSKNAPIWVGRPDDVLSCEPGSGMTLKDATRELQAKGVHIKDSRKGADGKAHIQMCGAWQGTYNLFQIPKKDMIAAKKIGYSNSGFLAPELNSSPEVKAPQEKNISPNPNSSPQL